MSKHVHQSLSELNGAEVSKPVFTSDQIVDPVVNMEIADPANEKFMNEMVEVTITSTGAENEEPRIQFAVNGMKQVFDRDVPAMCKRMFVEVMARCKKTNYVNTISHDHDGCFLQPKTSFVYPFTIQDSNPKGRDWLRAVRLEAN